MTDNQNLLPADNLPALQRGDPLLQISLNGRVLSFPVKWGRLAFFMMIPAWLRDSTIDPPEPSEQGAKQGFKKETLEFMRSGFKNLIRLKLSYLMKAVYGPDEAHWPQGVKLPKGREDVLPVIDRMLVDVLITQAYWHPLEITFDESTGFVTGFRLGQRLPPTVDAGNAAGAPGQDGKGSPSSQG